MESAPSDIAWEAMHAHYDQANYQAVLDQLSVNDVVLDIGAGDLRLARQIARMVKKVYAVEVNAGLLEGVGVLPVNLIVICADARTLDFPADITTGVLLMRHCTCFRLYADKLRKGGAARLITNARWRMNTEVVDLQVHRKSFAETGMGWYACLCGRTGFKEEPAEHWTLAMDSIVHEVSSCPQCLNF
jgi:Ribosomal RNA adenine dimethylase